MSSREPHHTEACRLLQLRLVGSQVFSIELDMAWQCTLAFHRDGGAIARLVFAIAEGDLQPMLDALGERVSAVQCSEDFALCLHLGARILPIPRAQGPEPWGLEDGDGAGLLYPRR